MDRAGGSEPVAGPLDPAMRHREVASRRLGGKLVVARPADGAPVVLAETATVVWRALDDWTSRDRIDERLGDVFPDVPLDARRTARAEILDALADDDLLERR